MYYGETEGTGYQTLDPRFPKLLTGHGRVERLWTGGRWLEGPAWFAAGRYLVCSDIPNNRMLRWDETDGSVSVFRAPSNNSNGNSVDAQGRLITCEHGSRRVTRTEHDGSITVLADQHQGKRLNSPNDLVTDRQGAIWFTDPSYGIQHDYEGGAAPMEQDGCHVYRIDPDASVTKVAGDFDKPNGLAFSPDQSLLYVADSGAPKHLRRFGVSGGKLTGGEVFAICTAGIFDGFRLDRQGRIWASAGDGVHCYDPDGTLLGKILIPELVANVEFAGARRNRLIICGCTSLYSVYLAVNGA